MKCERPTQIINGATNSNDKEGVCVEWVWVRGTRHKISEIKSVVWETHPKMWHPIYFGVRVKAVK